MRKHGFLVKGPGVFAFLCLMCPPLPGSLLLQFSFSLPVKDRCHFSRDLGPRSLKSPLRFFFFFSFFFFFFFFFFSFVFFFFFFFFLFFFFFFFFFFFILFLFFFFFFFFFFFSFFFLFFFFWHLLYSLVPQDSLALNSPSKPPPPFRASFIPLCSDPFLPAPQPQATV